MTDRSFQDDAWAVARARVRAGTLDRRSLLAAAAMLAGAGVVGSARGQAAKPRELVLANWGGDAVRAMEQAFGEPFQRDHGIRVAIDSAGPSLARIRTMVESGRTVWDVCDSGAGTSYTLGRAGLLERMDYTIIPKAQIPEAFAMEWSTGTSAYSTVLTWDTQKAGAEGPRNWAEFWDTRRFPGMRTMRRSMHAVLEAALMADGVPPEKVFPIDVDRALAKVRQIKGNVIWWTSGAQSQDLLRSGEVTMGAIWSTRARLLGEETRGRIAYRWDQGLVHAGVWNVPKNPPAGREWAMRFVASTIIPERQIALLVALGTGPANPAAAPLVPEALRPHNPTDPANLARQVLTDELWYADNYPSVVERFNDVISS
jgi:putative spermidine/putrescine transport system substrate-binding protein